MIIRLYMISIDIFVVNEQSQRVILLKDDTTFHVKLGKTKRCQVFLDRKGLL